MSRYRDDDDEFDDVRNQIRSYLQWKRTQYDHTPIEYWDQLDTSWEAYTTPPVDSDTESDD